MNPDEFAEFTEPIAAFKGFVREMKTDRRGQLLLTLMIPLQEKYDAIGLTDIPGLMIGFAAARRPRLLEPDDEADDDGI